MYTIYIHRFPNNKMISADEVDSYLAQGWQLGKPKF